MAPPALLEFSGPDAVRFLNGQVTQDVRLLSGRDVSQPSCVTDAKGRLRFRVWLTMTGDGALWVEGPPEQAEELEACLTRYLIADEVEVANRTGTMWLVHFTGDMPEPPPGVMARKANRFGVDGTDWWLPAGSEIEIPENDGPLAGDDLEAFRIARGIPAWGRELIEGMLPPEAGLDATDISYQKGCYIGQEVISRIKYVGKVNRRLVRLTLPEEAAAVPGVLLDKEGREAGEVTSISPVPDGGVRHALGYLKRGAERDGLVLRVAGATVPVRVTGDS
jgi:tRNA-modifying protein YgfZ